MTTEENKPLDAPEADSNEAEPEGDPYEGIKASSPSEEGGEAPLQLGSRRFVYGAYFGGGIVVAFLISKISGLIWSRLATWKPELGEPREELLLAISGVVGFLAAIYYWRKESARTYIEEVAAELAQVTWPTRKEVVSSTSVVIVATAVSTVFFALMDRLWSFVTNLVYGAA